jgi:hypothetical protein
MKRFAKTIVKVLVAYADIVKKEFPSHLKEERIVSVKNNLVLLAHSTFCTCKIRMLCNYSV